jgi:hypothetical protein
MAASGALPAQGAELSPAQVVAMRFPAGWGAASAATQPSKQAAAKPAATAAARAATWQPPANDLFSPYPSYLPRPAQSSDAASPPQVALAYADPVPEAAPAARPASAAYQLASASSAPERQRATTPRGAVLNDAQIASIRERLNLTPNQQRMWPAVEAALRGLVYKKLASANQKAAPVLDPASPEVSRLKSAAVPLVMSFNSEQRSELRTLAHLVGLGSLVAQF